MVGAEAEAKKNNWNVVIAVLDSGGNVADAQRMDGAQFGSIEVAKDKAYSAVAFAQRRRSMMRSAQGGANLRNAQAALREPPRREVSRSLRMAS